MISSENHFKYKKNIKKTIYFLTIICFLFLSSSYALADELNFLSLEGESIKDNKIEVNKSEELYDLIINEDKFPKELSWTWEGEGQAWLSVKYSDNNIIYCLKKNSDIPQFDDIKFIDSNGVPRIIKPKILEFPQDKVNIDLIESYHKYCGAKEVNIEEIQFYVNTKEKIKIENIKINEYQKSISEISNEDLLLLEDEIYIEAQIPQGNKQDYYLVKDMETPIQISVKSLIDKKTEGSIKIVIPDNMEVLNTTNENIVFINENTLLLPLEANAGYFEEKIILIVKSNITGKFTIETIIGENKKTVSKPIINYEIKNILDNLILIDEGVYPISNNEIQKELKNNINIKQNISDYIHRTFGDDEDETQPAGFITGVIKNTSNYDIPIHIKYSILNEDGSENEFFRGEHFLIESAVPPPVPETNIVINANSITEFQLPVYADVFSIEPGIYNSELNISFFGSNTSLIEKDFELSVYKETVYQNIIVVASISLALISFILLLWKQKKWLAILKSKELMLIALFTTVKFAIVDIPYSIFGKVIRGILAPLGPFTHLFTGIFSDLFDSILIVALVMLIPKPGVIIISKFVRIILGGIAFGSFNPVTIILSLSYALILEFFLYTFGFTSGKKKIDTKFNVFIIMAVVFGIQQIYATYTYYYVYMYLYRLFYPNWYINISTIFSVFYAIIGAVAGIYLGKKLKKVVE